MKSLVQLTPRFFARQSALLRSQNSKAELERLNKQIEKRLEEASQDYGSLKVTWVANIIFLKKFPVLMTDSDYYSIHRAFCLIACPFPTSFTKADKLNLMGMYSGYLHIQRQLQPVPRVILSELFHIFMRERYFLGAQTVFSKLAPDLPEFQDLQVFWPNSA